jgi:hypothetical protein
MAKEVKIFRISCPNKDFTGRRYGVMFEFGVGRTRDESVRDLLVRDLKYVDVTDELDPDKE